MIRINKIINKLEMHMKANPNISNDKILLLKNIY